MFFTIAIERSVIW